MKFYKKFSYSWWLSFYLSLEAGATGLLSYIAGILLGTFIESKNIQIGGLWCMISALVVLQSLLQDTKQASFIRIIGSFIGAIIAALICEIFGYGYWQLFLVIFLSIYVVNVFLEEKAARLSSATAGVIVIIGLMHPEQAPWLNSLMRFLESTLGVGIALFMVMMSAKIKLRKR